MLCAMVRPKKRGTKAKAKAKAARGARGSKFTMLLSRDESVQLRELAERDGVPASTLLRTLIRRLHDELRNPRRRTSIRVYDAATKEWWPRKEEGDE
jgi:hypothetical protein